MTVWWKITKAFPGCFHVRTDLVFKMLKRWGCTELQKNQTIPRQAEPQVGGVSPKSVQTELVGKLQLVDLALSLGTWAEDIFWRGEQSRNR